MKNTLIASLVLVVLVGGFLFIKEKNKPAAYEAWPETEPATVRPTTTNSPTQNNLSPVNPTPTNNQPKPNTGTASQTTSSSLLQNNGPTQDQAEAFVYQNWTNCSSGDCGGVTVTMEQDVGNQYLITAIVTEYDDSVATTKRQWLVLYGGGTLSLASNQPNPNTWRVCHVNRGHQTFETTPCN